MKRHLKESIDMFPQLDRKETNETVTSPARPKLRDVNEECDKLSGKKRDGFYSIVAKLLQIMKRARPDLETAIGFICTRVNQSYEDDWNKLRRVITNVNNTIEDCRIIGVTDLTKIFI